MEKKHQGGFVSDKIEANESVINNRHESNLKNIELLNGLNVMEKYKIVIIEGNMMEERAIRITQELLKYKIYREYIFQNDAVIILKLRKQA